MFAICKNYEIFNKFLHKNLINLHINSIKIINKFNFSQKVDWKGCRSKSKKFKNSMVSNILDKPLGKLNFNMLHNINIILLAYKIN